MVTIILYFNFFRYTQHPALVGVKHFWINNHMVIYMVMVSVILLLENMIVS